MKDILEDFDDNFEDEYPYPLTVVADRYSGTYSGGAFTAWNLEPDEVPTAIGDSDVPCAQFWGTASDHYYVGKGSTPEAAIFDLKYQLSLGMKR